MVGSKLYPVNDIFRHVTKCVEQTTAHGRERRLSLPVCRMNEPKVKESSYGYMNRPFSRQPCKVMLLGKSDYMIDNIDIFSMKPIGV